MSNQEQIDYWSGETGDTWVQSQVRIDAMMEPITNALLAQSGDARGKRTLDVGCGCGTTSLALAEVAAEVTGVDVSAPMLAEARRRSAGVANLSYLEADASSVHFDRPFEFAVSRFGVMFFTDPTAAFTHLHGQLAPSAPLLFVCWAAPADNAWFSTAAAAVNPLMPPPPAPVDPRAPGPFAFADPEDIRTYLSAAHFRDISIEPLTADLPLGATLDEAVAFQSQIGPLSRAIRALEAKDAQGRDEAVTRVRASLARFDTGGTIELPGKAWLVRATA